MENNGGELFTFLVGVEIETEEVRDGEAMSLGGLRKGSY